MMSYSGWSPEKEKELKKRMQEMNIFEKDIHETFTRSSGPGGQNANKVSTCVVLLHQPSGIKVKYQKERMQGLNRYKARCLLIEKIKKYRSEINRRARQSIEKKKRQNRKRPKFLKEAILENKRQHSKKKALRKKIGRHKLDQYM